MVNFVTAVIDVLRESGRPLATGEIASRLRGRVGIPYLGRCPETTVAARLGARAVGADGLCEVEPGVWALFSNVPDMSGAIAGVDVSANPDSAWRGDVLHLVKTMGYRNGEPVAANRWTATIGWGSAETRVLIELADSLDGALAEVAPERVAALRRSLDHFGCLAGLLVARGIAGEAALAETRRAGAPLITLVDGAVLDRSLSGRETRRR